MPSNSPARSSAPLRVNAPLLLEVPFVTVCGVPRASGRASTQTCHTHLNRYFTLHIIATKLVSVALSGRPLNPKGREVSLRSQLAETTLTSRVDQ